MQENRVRSLGWEDPLEKGMATNCNILAWRIPWTEEPGGLQSVDHKELDITEQLTHLFTATLFTMAKIWKQPQCPSKDE